MKKRNMEEIPTQFQRWSCTQSTTIQHNLRRDRKWSSRELSGAQWRALEGSIGWYQTCISDLGRGGNTEDISRTSQRNIKEIWRKYEGNMKEMSGKYQGSREEIWKKYGGNIKEMYRRYKRNIKNMYRKLIGNPPKIHKRSQPLSHVSMKQSCWQER